MVPKMFRRVMMVLVVTLVAAADASADPSPAVTRDPADVDQPGRTGASAQPVPQAPSTNPTQVIALPNQPPTPGVLGDFGGARGHLVEQGLTIAAGIYFDSSRNFQGGLTTRGTASREFFDLDVTYTTDKYWHGGTFFFNFLDHQGPDASGTLTGDLQGFDNQDAPHGDQIYQAYYQQLLANDAVRIKVGRIDATTDFAFTANGSAFLGSSFGYSPAITSFPTYPDPALGAAVFWTPGDHFYATGGIDYTNRSDRTGILTGSPYLARASAGGVFLIIEAGAKWTIGDDKLSGRVGVGGYHHTGRFGRFDQTVQTGTGGMFAVLDQTLWQSIPGTTPSPGVGVFAQYGLADGRVSPIDQHVGAGFSWTGPVPIQSRAADVTGVGASYVHLSTHATFARDHELAIEAFYKLQFTPWFNVQPDVQYILTPSGRAGRDAVVGTIRAELDF